MKYLQCDPIDTFEPFYITAIREREDVYHEVPSKYTMLSACYVINLKPPLYLRNALPIDIQISVAGCTVSQGEKNIKESNINNHQLVKDYKGPLNASLTKSDFLDCGEKVVEPGDLLHLPTVKTTAKEGERRSLIVARVSIFRLNVNNEKASVQIFKEKKNAGNTFTVGPIFGKRLVMHNRSTNQSTGICCLVFQII